MSGVVIKGTGAYLPALCVDNEAFTKILDTSDEWIRTRTGIRTRHFSDGEPGWSMGLKAARQALDSANLRPEEIDLILGTTVTPDYCTPSLACVLQGKLGAVNAIAFDISCACAGFVYALDLANRYLMTDDKIKNVLIVGSEMLSRVTNFEDRASCVLFGDGAGAAVVSAADALFTSSLKVEGMGAGQIFGRYHGTRNPFCNPSPAMDYDEYGDYKEGCLYMNGKEVYKFATRVMAETVTEAAAKAGITPAEIDLIIPHQANIRIIETAAQRLHLPMERFAVNIQKYGNTSSACIPICLDEVNRAGRLKKGDKVCFVGFGAGLVAGAALIEWQ
ncbi:MAG: ketoacyl-ACP synthase III [Oscillospiraceae bacterium]|nr:ketoacyl-ACP synthase III [Oscillospiraceae bacterium]